MRDRYFQATRPLSEYVRLAQERRRDHGLMKTSAASQPGRIVTISVLFKTVQV
jgi:hypothetical protein